MDEVELKSRLKELTYPCYIICYGPERTYRTKFRREHGGIFFSEFVDNAEQAFKMIEIQNYEGYYSEMDLRAIYIEERLEEDGYNPYGDDNRGKLTETRI